nr:Ku protein [Mesorhizobium sp. M8A.F.Ca.ET.057.01.1.1]
MAGFAGTIAGGVRLLAICHRGTRMTAPRAAWKGFLKVGSVTCGVKIVGATSEASKVHFKILNRKDGLPVKSAYIDEATEEEVEPEDQVKGFEIDKDSYIHVEPDELKS